MRIIKLACVAKLSFIVTLWSCAATDDTQTVALKVPFKISALTELRAQDSKSLKSLCALLAQKKAKLLTQYPGAVWPYRASSKTCEASTPQIASLELSVVERPSGLFFQPDQPTGVSLIFPAVELLNSLGSFAIFCAEGASNRYVETAAELKHFYISETEETIDVTILYSKKQENQEVNYVAFAREEISYFKAPSSTIPLGLEINRSLTSSQRCEGSDESFKRMELIREFERVSDF